MRLRVLFLVLIALLVASVGSAKRRAQSPPSPSSPQDQPIPPPPPPPPAAVPTEADSSPIPCPVEGQRMSVAVYPINPAGAEASLAAAMTELLTSKLTSSPQLRVIEEAMLKTVMERQAMNISDACDDTICQVEIGKLVQAQKIITGGLTKFGSKYILSLKLVDVASGSNDFSNILDFGLG